MAQVSKILITMLMLLLSSTIIGKSYLQTADGYILNAIVEGNDTIPIIVLKEHIVFPKYTNKKDVQKYERLIRDIKRVYPYAKLIASEVERVNPTLEKIKNPRDRKKYMKEYENQLFKQYEPELKKFSLRQGKLLIKLIDRECDRSSYELIREFRGSITAFFWQGFARILGANLKDDFDTNKSEDAMINRIIILIEAGQL